MSASLPIRRILCPTDFSEYSLLSLRHAVRLGRWFDAGITVLHVIPARLPVGAEPYFPIPAAPDPVLRTRAEEELGRFVEPILHFGSTSSHVVREATCPVLTVRTTVEQGRSQEEREATAVLVAGRA